ncbi:MAG: regulatory iron-sulfur-containing complex subunit RicT [Coriobacteriia bacterium]|nr:regulatory iron-sulfur-containing complex subunit RicT [Coriobacteriia bacterium]
MTKIAPVKTVKANTSLWFDAGDLDIKVGQNVIVETARGIEFGTLDSEIFEATDEDLKVLKSDLKPVKRIATQKDVEQADEMAQKSIDAFPIFQKHAKETNEDMVPISVEYLHDGRKAVFYFSAPERQDFRDLVKKLSSEFHLRVDMRQINEREKSAQVSGIGFCGQELCCARLGRCPKHVSIKQAKEQGMALNPENISGMCGKLLCCLEYEYEDYKEFNSRAPKLKAKISTPEGEAVVTEVNMPREYVEVKIGENEKRVKVPLDMMETDSKFAKSLGNETENLRPNKIGKEAWEKVQEENSVISLESVYTTQTLKGSEKLATGVVKTLPNVKRRGSKTFGGEKSEENKPRPRKNNRRNNQKRSKNAVPKGNVYESNKTQTVRRRTRKLDSSAARPGQNSSGLRK